LIVVSNLAIAAEDVNTTGDYATTVRPFLSKYCLDCHGEKVQEAKLSLASLQTRADLASSPQIWDEILERLESGEMPPPEDAKSQPTAKERESIIAWLIKARDEEAAAHAGDPGPVLLRRLSNAEYDYTIRDLTGVDIRPTRTFPVDPANEAGFDNSGESLTISPALFEKYLAAAREVSEHVVMSPNDLMFAPHPVVTDTDRDKYCVKRIVKFYDRHEVQLADYLFACWLVHKQQQSQPAPANESLRRVADRQDLSAKYLATVYKLLNDRKLNHGPLKVLRAMWNGLSRQTEKVKAVSECQRIADFVQRFRRAVEPKVENLDLSGSHKGSQPFVLWKNRQYSANRRTFNADLFRGAEDVEITTVNPSIAPVDVLMMQSMRIPRGTDRNEFLKGVGQFCSVFPDAYAITERGRDYVGTPRAEQEKGRLLSAGFHSMMGYYRDDQPLYDLVLDEQQQVEINELWDELNFVASAPQRQYVGFLWFERTDSRYMRDPEFDFVRAEDKSALTERMIKQLNLLYAGKATRSGGNEVVMGAIERYFRDINQQIRSVEKTWATAEKKHLTKLLQFAERAYRRPLAEQESASLAEFYRTLREVDGLDHENAIRDAVVSILMSPHFLLRTDLGGTGPDTRPLTQIELANRLSYFMWSSMPDAELHRLAAEDELTNPDVLLTQTSRMLADERVRGLAVEFMGNWLDFRRFENHNAVDRERFPSFDDRLRSAMYEEPLFFLADVARRDRPITDFLDAKDTFVNGVLAKHYGIPNIAEDAPWQPVEDATPYGRGGLLSMAVFLTKNSPGLRTSPVKRGYWVARRVLGERIPPPPPNVPELPEDESQFKEQSLREILAEHREHPNCAACHERFDAMGLVFENYGPIGELRKVDLADRPVNTEAVLPGEFSAAGLADLRTYLQRERNAEFVDNLCRKFLAFALGRTLLRSDDTLILDMKRRLAQNEYRFSTMVQTVILSPQFLNKRTTEVQKRTESEKHTESEKRTERTQP
jgi:hypothetical protein